MTSDSGFFNCIKAFISAETHTVQTHTAQRQYNKNTSCKICSYSGDGTSHIAAMQLQTERINSSNLKFLLC